MGADCWVADRYLAWDLAADEKPDNGVSPSETDPFESRYRALDERHAEAVLAVIDTPSVFASRDLREWRLVGERTGVNEDGRPIYDEDGAETLLLRFDQNVRSSMIEAATRELQTLFGPLWRLSGGYDSDEVYVRCVEAVAFAYTDESQAAARAYAFPEAVPDRVPAGTGTWGECSWLRPVSEVAYGADYIVVASSTGTRHLVRGDRFTDTSVFEGARCECGYTVDAEMLAGGEHYQLHAVAAYQAIAAEATRAGDPAPDPRDVSKSLRPTPVIGNQLCGSCGDARLYSRRCASLVEEYYATIDDAAPWEAP